MRLITSRIVREAALEKPIELSPAARRLLRATIRQLVYDVFRIELELARKRRELALMIIDRDLATEKHPLVKSSDGDDDA